MRHAMLTLSVCLALTGCGSTTERTTPPPPRGEPVHFDVANQMIDQMTMVLASDLPDAPVVRSHPYMMVLAIGPNEVIGFREPERFESAMRTLQGRLLQNARLRDNFKLVTTSRADASDILSEVSGTPRAHLDPTGSNEDQILVEEYNPDDVIVLTGRFHQTAEGSGRKAYRLQVSVEHPRRRQTVLTEEIRRDFVWNPETAAWMTVVD